MKDTQMRRGCSLIYYLQPIRAATDLPLTDTMSPTLTTLDPDFDQTAVKRSSNIKATYAEELDKQTVNSSTVRLFPLKGGDLGAPVAPAPVSCDTPCKVVTLNPYGKSSKVLAKNTWYLMTLLGGENGVKDKAGNPVAPEGHWISWWFQTGSR